MIVSLLFSPHIRAESERGEWEKWFIKSNKAVSEWFDGAAEGLDLFLAGRKLTNRPNESFLRIENSTHSMEGQEITNSTGLIVNPRLPNLEEFWHLKFSTYDEQEERRSAKNDYLRQTQRRKNYGASVGMFRKLGNIRTAFQPRIELQDPLKVSHSLTFESVADSRTFWVNPKIEFYASPEKGVGIFQALNFNFILSKVYALTLINQGDYEDRQHLYTVTNGLSLGQILTEQSTLSYNILFTTTNRPSYMLESYNISVSCSQLIYKRVLDFQIIPNVDFAYTNQFNGVAGLTVVFNLHF
ncbi:MAG: hypothetical protein IPM97_09065 [Bdellovibrionaceae bacterium]|nr:hypothetical protein [Pseudobdellovibrionaceae bacterium]